MNLAPIIAKYIHLLSMGVVFGFQFFWIFVKGRELKEAPPRMFSILLKTAAVLLLVSGIALIYYYYPPEYLKANKVTVQILMTKITSLLLIFALTGIGSVKERKGNLKLGYYFRLTSLLLIAFTALLGVILESH